MIRFYVAGTPVPQGNKSAIVRGGRAVVVEGRRAKARNQFTEWRVAVRQAAADARGDVVLDGPVLIQVHFALPRPASAPKRRRTYAVKRPDLDKLTRAVLDGCTEARLFGDDSQVVDLRATKDYPGPDGRIGAWVEAWTLDDGTDVRPELALGSPS